MIFPQAIIRRIFKEEGANRVSEDALVALNKFIEGEARAVAKNANRIATANNRKTTFGKDVELVVDLD